MECEDTLLRIFHFCDPKTLMKLKASSPFFQQLIDRYEFQKFAPNTIPIFLGRIIQKYGNIVDAYIISETCIKFSPSLDMNYEQGGFCFELLDQNLQPYKNLFILDKISSTMKLDEKSVFNQRFDNNKFYMMEVHYRSVVCLFSITKKLIKIDWNISPNPTMWFANTVLSWNLPQLPKNKQTYVWLSEDHAFLLLIPPFFNSKKEPTIFHRIHKNGEIVESKNIIFSKHKSDLGQDHHWCLLNSLEINSLGTSNNSPLILGFSEFTDVTQHYIVFFQSELILFVSKKNERILGWEEFKEINIVKSFCHSFQSLQSSAKNDKFVFLLPRYTKTLFWLNNQGQLFESALNKDFNELDTVFYMINDCTIFSMNTSRYFHYSVPQKSIFSTDYYGLRIERV